MPTGRASARGPRPRVAPGRCRAGAGLTNTVHLIDQRTSARFAVGTLGLVTIVAYGVAYYSYGVLVDPIRADTGWSPAALGAIFSAVLVVGGVGGLAGGWLVDRSGTRPAFLLSGTVGALAIALASYQTRLTMFAVLYAGGCGVIAALGFYHVTQPAAIRAAAKSPDRAVVWLTILGAFASPIFLPLAAEFVGAFGWRGAIRAEALIAAATFLIAAAVDRRPPRRVDKPAGARAHVREALIDAWRTPRFRRWLLASVIGGAAVDVILVYQAPIMIGAGLPIVAAATVAGLRGFAQLAGRLPLFPLLRCFGTRGTVVLSFLTAGGGVLLLLGSGQLEVALAFSILAGASIGAMSTLQGIYTNELVGTENLGLLMGTQQAIFAVGGAAGPLLAGILFAAEHSYTLVVVLTAGALLFSPVILASPRLSLHDRTRPRFWPTSRTGADSPHERRT